MKRAIPAAAVVLALVIGQQLSLAHHSFAVYDFEQQIEFVGKVQSLNFKNPHIAMTLSTTGADGQPIVVNFIEGAPANMLARKGLRPDMIAVGTEITAFGSPLIEDPSKYFLRRVRLADGREFE